ncbi:MAG: histidinol dehydrogenase [Epsilonproteobacteria bacterium]|nr:histidinol dehydrogenase [Campylobacterota bacterium]NPA56844.1 histidinol dehydrogenase [Campylobacterota bacterium]
MRVLATEDPGFDREFQRILDRAQMDMEEVTPVVQKILKEIREEGDRALMAHIAQFDRWEPRRSEELLIDPGEMERAYRELDPQVREALHTAYERIEAYHRKQLPKSWIDCEENGTILGQKVTPVERAGLYIPGGKAAYPSSLLMNGIPAIVAGVKEIVVTTPTPENEPNPLLLAACHLCGFQQVYKVGGASAIGALAFGTETIPKVDVITGPGNIFVATAKKLVYGEVNIDMIAGPSEIGILADGGANPRYVAIDLLSQAEHDEMASSILITPSRELAQAVQRELSTLLQGLERREIATRSIEERGAIIVTSSMEEGIELMNRIAPEHLEIMTADPFQLLPKIRDAGAIFLGEFTPEPIGDYIAGPNHTLPTGGTARFYSPLSTEHFLKKSSIISFSPEAVEEIGGVAATLAYVEGLQAHAQSIEERLKDR